MPGARYGASDASLAVDGPSSSIAGEQANILQQHRLEPVGETDDKVHHPAGEVVTGSIDSNGVEEGANTAKQTQERQQVVVEMFRHAWKGYTSFAWGSDELLPLTKTGTSSYGLGLTIVDSLDTMWLMGLTEEFQEARKWVANSLNIAGNHREVSVFETNIRVLGGLLSAYHLSKDDVFLRKAVSFVNKHPKFMFLLL